MIRLPTITISKNCIQCNTLVEFDVKAEDYDLWVDKIEFIEDALWYIPADKREMLLSGVCGNCWNKLFEEDEEEDED
jgi:hypothetical protein